MQFLRVLYTQQLFVLASTSIAFRCYFSGFTFWCYRLAWSYFCLSVFPAVVDLHYGLFVAFRSYCSFSSVNRCCLLMFSWIIINLLIWVKIGYTYECRYIQLVIVHGPIMGCLWARTCWRWRGFVQVVVYLSEKRPSADCTANSLSRSILTYRRPVQQCL